VSELYVAENQLETLDGYYSAYVSKLHARNNKLTKADSLNLGRITYLNLREN
jgi:hypothetical protein